MTILFSVLLLKNKFTCILRKFFIEKSKSFPQIENNENNDYKIKKPLELSFQRTLYVREKIRTPDTLVRSQVLYPAELRTHIKLSWSPRMPATGIEPVLYCYNRILSPARLPVPPRRHVILSGTNRARTYDPLLVRQMLSQLSYDPI